MSQYEIVFHGEFPKVRHRASGELMHAVGSSDAEIETIYIQASRLHEKLQISNAKPLMLWDVGLGASLNASAAIRAAESSKRKLKIISFENDLTSANLVCERAELFPSVDSEMLKKLLETHQVIKESLEWILVEGDFAKVFSDSLKYGVPDICFYDPFSPKTDTEMWSFDLFKELHENVRDSSFELFTYSQSTAVRASLLAAGFYVAEGSAAPPKESSTIACTRAVWTEASHHFLGERWLERWRRSSSQIPQEIAESIAKKALFLRSVEEHEQFQRVKQYQ